MVTVKALALVAPLLLAAANPALAATTDPVNLQVAQAARPPAPPPPFQPRGSAPDRGGMQEARPPVSEDAQFIQPDDYFVQTGELGANPWIWVFLAKMVTVPSAATKGEAEFMKIRDGQNLWARDFWKTRLASRDELHLGMSVIAFNDITRDDVYCSPDRKDGARSGSWFLAKIIDLSDAFKGYVLVGGGFKVSLNNIRVLEK